MLSQIRFQAILAALVPILVLASILAYVLDSRLTIKQTAFWADHARRALAASGEYMNALTEENRTVTMYDRAHDRHFILAFAQTRAATNAAAAKLLSLASTNAAERERAKAEVHVGQLADGFLARYFALERRDRTVELRRMANASSTRVLSAKLRDATLAFDSAERDTALEKLAEFNALLGRFSTILITALVAGIVLFLFTSIVFGTRIALRAVRLRRNAQILRHGGNPHPLEGDDELAIADSEYRAVLERLREEHNNATLLQRALLPQRLPSVPGIRIDASYAPSSNQSVVGGDWYDVFPVGDGRLGISVGDVAGHGLHAATTMALMRQSVRMAARLSQGPAEVLQSVNRIAYEDGGPLVTMFYGELSLVTGVLRYAVAGHPMPITVRASGVVEQMRGEGLIMGVERRVEYEEYELALDAGSGIVLFTDGLIEEGRKEGIDYFAGSERLLEVVNRQYYSAAENIAHAIQRDVFEGRAPLDDAAVLFIGITDIGAARAASSQLWSIDTKTAASARRAKRAFLWHLGEFAADGTDLSETELIFGELLGNVARHTPGRADITLEIIDDRALLHVCDEGLPIVRAQQDPETLAESGRGLILIESLARSMTIARTDRGNCVTVELPVVLDRFEIGTVTPRRIHRALEFHQERNGATRAGAAQVHHFAENRRK